ncbi:MAG: hypothetical protein HW380_2090 [Magnetococcales bacterium]|nr:hypothetical protein [Magnetococcales bacterium]HIJ84329.1 hypothetical protein [Magnetococcales bacterium]
MATQGSCSNSGDSCKDGGLPQGATVALVGDPGTGKTTFLLEYYRRASVGKGCVGFENEHPLNKLDGLLRRPESKDGEEKPDGVLRCFISLESSFSRMLATHGAFFEKENIENKNAFVFIDATSFLSGRVEDELRYPHLQNRAGNHNNSRNNSGYTQFNFSMEDISGGGCALRFLDESDAHVIRPKELGEIKGECNSTGDYYTCTTPFCQDHRCRTFTLMTRPLPDPQVRIRLLKDLLAEMFSRFKGQRHRLVVIDSLSALLDGFVGDDRARESGGRRLHILNLIRWLEEIGVTTLFSSEAVRDGGYTLRRQPLFLGTQERYLAAGVIQLDYHQYRSGDLIRYFRILKMRGASHDMRPHAYDIGQNGIAWVEPLFGERDEEGV